MKKVGIMGGTFDPIHLGHLVVANEVLNIYNLDQIIFVPAGNPPHKKGMMADPAERYMMANLATVSNHRFTVSDFEINKGSKCYSVDTLREFRRLYPETEFYFITGTDAVIELPSWHEPEELMKLCKFIAVSRPGTQNSEQRIQEVAEKLKGHIEILRIPMLQISSTDIRERILNGMSAKYMLPESVEQYICKNGLYR